MRTVMTDPRGAAAALRDQDLGERSPLADGPGLSAGDRIAIYADGYFQRLLGSLGSDYPAVKRALGPSFQLLVAAYLMEHASTSASLADAGEQLPAFIATHELSAEHPFIADLAALERAVLRSLLTDRGLALDGSRLQQVSESQWTTARVALQPSVALLRTAWAVDLLRDSEAAGATLSPPCQRWLVVARGPGGVEVRPVEAEEWSALVALADGETLGDVCGRLESAGLDAELVSRWFATWVRSGWVSEMSVVG